MKTKSQNEKILDYMKTHKRGITSMTAVEKFGCYRLAARIADLRKQGYDIESRLICKRNRDGVPVQFSEYRLV